ncbi:MAG: GNAT family N-acetyltransferase, partial [Finegoldia magna]|nr:GNAT family N-acetyltransferase [Finegoldia magna]
MQTHIKTFEQLTTKELFNIYKLRVDTFVVEQQCPY